MGMFEKSNNPLFNEEKVRAQTRTISMSGTDSMTKEGAINKSTLLVGIMLLTSLYSFTNPSSLMIWGGLFGGLALYFVTMWKPSIANITAPIYAAFEGLLVGGLSAIYGGMQGGLVFKAVIITISILLTMLIVYRTGLIKVTEKFRSVLIAATGAIFVVYMISIALSFFGMSVPLLHTGTPLSMIISVGILVIASLNFLLDFDFVDRASKMNLPKYYEWYAGMSLLATLVWVYIEVLRLLYLSRD